MRAILCLNAKALDDVWDDETLISALGFSVLGFGVIGCRVLWFMESGTGFGGRGAVEIWGFRDGVVLHTKRLLNPIEARSRKP